MRSVIRRANARICAAGILHGLLCSPAHPVAPHWAAIEGTVDWLLGLQQPSGNWPHKASRAEHEPEDADQLIQYVLEC